MSVLVELRKRPGLAIVLLVLLAGWAIVLALALGVVA